MRSTSMLAWPLVLCSFRSVFSSHVIEIARMCSLVAADFLVPWLFKSFCSFFWNGLWALGAGVVLKESSIQGGHPMISCSLHFELWFSVMVSVVKRIFFSEGQVLHLKYFLLWVNFQRVCLWCYITIQDNVLVGCFVATSSEGEDALLSRCFKFEVVPY